MYKTFLSCLLFMIIFLQSYVCQAEELVLRENTLGPITKSTPYSLPALQKLLPGYKVKKSLGVSEGTPYDTIVVYSNRKPQLTIVPKNLNVQKTIYCISFTSKQVKNNLGAAIGATFASVYPDGKSAACVPAHEEMSGLEICAAPNASHVIYVFVRNKRWNGSNDKTPPLSVLKEWTLKQITWLPGDDDVLKDHQYCKAIDLYSND
jgi:hypothetical protein